MRRAVCTTGRRVVYIVEGPSRATGSPTAALLDSNRRPHCAAQVAPKGPDREARSTRATMPSMTRSITQRELRNSSGEIMRGLDRGESFLVTRNGVPVGELTPVRSRQFVAAGIARAIFASAPAVDPGRFRSDIDAVLDQDITPRV